ncbi:MAG: replication restart helicase PriA [Bacteroidales bacterium]
MQNYSLYAEVILPLPLPGTFTYAVPSGWEAKIKPGIRALVPFGVRRILSGVVASVTDEVPEVPNIKPLTDILDETPVVVPFQITFWQWIAEYYMCTLGEVSKAALPSGLKLESETRMFVREDFVNADDLSPAELAIFSLLQKKKGLRINDIAKQLQKSTIYHPLKNLLDKGAISASESLKEGYHPPLKAYLHLHAEWTSPASHTLLFEKLKKAPRQLQAVQSFLRLAEKEPFPDKFLIAREDFMRMTGVTPTIIKSLVERDILVIDYLESVSQREIHAEPVITTILEEAQQKCLDEIKNHFEKTGTVLLHGVTSSGKTEIYIHLISEYLRQGKQVLYLLPEIALTSQIIRRLQKVFGNLVYVYHSRFSDTERIATWKELLPEPTKRPGPSIVLGVRSSVFLPFTNLGLVIVDEEHENTYKQFDPAPRYHARDAAIVLAGLHGAKVLLGSATPSVESMFNCQTGKYALSELKERYGNIKLPAIEVVDMRIERKKRPPRILFSDRLSEEIKQVLKQKEQVILFQNRRGFAPYLQCHECGWVPVCKHCDVSLVYHKRLNQLVCHYCGTVYPGSMHCRQCGSTDLRTMGSGTEKIEEEISILFPGAKVARMDLDSTRSRASYERILNEFEQGTTNILVGTQMITKGLDFDRVQVVGIINADNLLNFPDFRSFERAFQLMEQVSGRAGRRDRQGKVIIQTSQPEHRIIRAVMKHDFHTMLKEELRERKIFQYPPFSRLIRITIRHSSEEKTTRAALHLAEMFRATFPGRVTGPDLPAVGRIQNKYLRNILIKLERGKNLEIDRKKVAAVIEQSKQDPLLKSVEIVPDVDPY